ncbi:restriction endonuclease [Luteimonas aquatica]|uniref:restriction endonuclease n=1 Tax=Luteimonas aquatica TaxID=450364 RepID=UPI001F5828A3|nr:restriction endonuclease [Luteimonas aquatica]
MDKHGLKQVRNRRNDALTRVRWDRLEALLADYYTAQGYRVEHVGTGGTGRRFDGGIDLKLRKDEEYILVQCKGWNAYQVPHNEVHQLIGLMVNESATGAILVTAGEFTRAAVEAAARGGHVQLVDGDDLRGMLGPLPEEQDTAAFSRGGDEGGPVAGRMHTVAAMAGDRLLSAVEDRIRYGPGSGPRSGPGKRAGVGRVVAFGIGAKVIILSLTFLLMVFVIYLAARVFFGVTASRAPAEIAIPVQQTGPAKPIAPATAALPPVDAEPAVAPTSQDPLRREPTSAEIRRSRHDADEAMKVIEDSTPEM